MNSDIYFKCYCWFNYYMKNIVLKSILVLFTVHVDTEKYFSLLQISKNQQKMLILWLSSKESK